MFLRANVRWLMLVMGLLLFTPVAWSGRELPLGANEAQESNEFLIKLKQGSDVATLVARYFPGASIRSLGALNLHLLKLPGSSTLLQRGAMAAETTVEFIEPNRIRKTLLAPNDSLFSSQWALQNVQAAQAWSTLPGRFLTSATATGSRIRVAVLDTGADCTHPDFANTGSSSRDAASGGQFSFSLSQGSVLTTIVSPACPWQDDHGHGTHTAGIIGAAANNSIGVAGLGYPVQLVIYKVLDQSGSGSDATISSAIISATDAGVNVISMSLGASGYSQTLEAAVQYAWQHNVLVVAAAGNNGSSVLTFPGGATHALGVAAIDSNNLTASFSNFGDYVEVAAPGVSILSTMTTYPTPLGGGTYGNLSGTSMATPYVAALGGLLSMTTPGIAADAITQRILQSAASPSVNGGWDAHLGYGAIRAYNALAGVLRASTSGAVRGRVSDGSNLPLAATVTLNGQTVSTDPASGLFRFPSLSPGKYPIHVTAGAFAAQDLSVTVAPGADSVIGITMGTVYGSISGTVTDSLGSVAYIVVQALSGSTISASTVSDANGNYTLWVPGGAYTLRASGMSRVSTSASGSVTGAGTATVNLTAPLLGRIYGTIRNASGVVAGAQILASGPGGTFGAITDASGTFSTIGVPAGSYSVLASTASESGSASVSVNGDTAANLIIGALTYTIDSTPAGRTLLADGVSCTAPCSLAWSSGSSHTIAVGSPQAGAAGTQYVFGSWSDGGAQSHAITAPASPSTFTANFTTQYLLTTAASPAAGGTITAGGWFNSGAGAVVSAAANSGYTFAGFTGALSGTTATQNLTMNAPATVTANFTAVIGGNGSWYGTWTTRRKLTVNHAQVTGSTALANFPVLVSITDAELKSTSNAGKVGKLDGTDIVFTAADGVSKLNHEIESYDPVAGKLVAWVQAPSVSPSVDAVLYLYYGNAGAADQQNKTGVWDSGYRIVNHFKDAAGSDSTQYQNTATPSGAATLVQTGVAGPAYTVDGVSGQLSIPYNTSWNAAFSSYTIEFWMKPGALQDYSAVLAGGVWGTPFSVWVYNPNTVVLRMDTTGGYCSLSGALPLDGAFHHLVMAYDSGFSKYTVYMDGVAWPYPATCTGNMALPAQALTIGRFNGGRGIAATFDELRISAGTVRSADWIATGFNNQKAPGSFYAVGASEANGGAPAASVVTSSPTGLSLTVDGAACTTPCSFSWSSGSAHTVAAASNAQYTFVSWSDGGAQSHTITAPATVTANFTAVIGGNGSWYGTWTTRRKLTVNHAQVTGSTALANFPVLVSITDVELRPSFNGGKVGKVDGTDIVFTAADGLTKLNHEIESYDAVAGKLVAWVQLPSVSPVTDTALYLYYGNSGAADQQNKTAVWDSGYRIVNHFKDAAGSDSTQYQNTATPSGAATLVQSGVAGPAYTVDGVSGQLSIPYNTSWNAAFSSYTVEFWMKPGALQDYSALLASGSWGTSFDVWVYNPGTVVLRMDTTGGYCSLNGPLPIDGAFHHLAMAYDSAPSKFNVYVDGVAWPYPATCTGNVALPAQALTIGRFNGGKGISATFDELRVSAGIPRSQDWIATGYNNQKAPASFYAIGLSETHP